MIAPTVIPPERDWRGPGCDDRCRTIKAFIPGQFGRSELLLHDADAHETYGRSTCGWVPPAVVVTGRLAVDPGRLSVLVDGQPVWPTPTELNLLLILAARLDRLVYHDDLIERIWGAHWAVLPPGDFTHALRVNVARLRARMGSMAALLVTVPGFGYRLVAAEPDVDTSTWPSRSPMRAAGRWSITWDACRRCERTTRRHSGNGYCSGCRRYAARHGLLGKDAS